MDAPGLYKEAIVKWGLDAQLDMLQEECAELIMAVNKHRRSKGRKKTCIAEEIVDVQIMIEQVRYGLMLQTKINRWREIKLKRLARRLKK
jgi:NTP pyrophosphatase (non-canonical NTP hydrolase)